MKEVFEGLGLMYMLSVIVMIAVIVAMAVDFVSGWRKAKIRGDDHTSYAASRTLTKFLIYEGMLIIGVCMDTMVHFAWGMFMESSYNVPLLTICIGVVLCIVEGWSVKEKAEDKQRKQIDNAMIVLGKVFGDEALKELAKEYMRKQMKDKISGGAVDESERTLLNEDNF